MAKSGSCEVWHHGLLAPTYTEIIVQAKLRVSRQEEKGAYRRFVRIMVWRTDVLQWTGRVLSWYVIGQQKSPKLQGINLVMYNR